MTSYHLLLLIAADVDVNVKLRYEIKSVTSTVSIYMTVKSSPKSSVLQQMNAECSSLYYFSSDSSANKSELENTLSTTALDTCTVAIFLIIYY